MLPAPQGAYAQREAAWLVVAAWNRGTLHGRYGRPSQAGQYMRLALDLLRLGHCPAELAERHQVGLGIGRGGWVQRHGSLS